MRGEEGNEEGKEEIAVDFLRTAVPRDEVGTRLWLRGNRESTLFHSLIAKVEGSRRHLSEREKRISRKVKREHKDGGLGHTAVISNRVDLREQR